MSNLLHEKHTTDFDAIRLSVASPERILEWSHGEVLKPETINYRTQKPEKDGLFCEKIFGPTRDWECYCGKYKGMHYRGIICDRCGVLVARSIVRRERMGHISLAMPVTHTWFLRGTPSSVGLILSMTAKNLEKVVYFANYVIIEVDEGKKKQAARDLETNYKADKEKIKQKFDKQASKQSADVKSVAEAQAAALEELESNFQNEKKRLEQLVPKVLLSENDYHELNRAYRGLFEAGIGAQAILKLLANTDIKKTVRSLAKQAEEAQGARRKKILKRLKMLEGMAKAAIEPEWMILEHLPVIPPDLRPMVQLTGGRFATSDLNDLYRRVINRNNRLKKLIDMKAPEVICRNEMRMLQEAVDALIDNAHTRSGRAVSTTGGRRRLKSLSDMLRGKQGRFRQNLLGKRVDYSGRSVIVAGPELRIDECGIPKMMALELFKPFVIGRLIDREIAHNVKAASRLIDRSDIEVWDALDEVIANKYVLLNRAPTLHRLGVQAFKPTLIEGKAVQLHPLVCKGFNADFDGDQMAVHLPLSAASQWEAKQIMAANLNLLKPSDGSIITHLSHEMVLGIYYATYLRQYNLEKSEQFYADSDEAIQAFDKNVISLQTPIQVTIKGEPVKTTVGRILFNHELPADFGYRNQTFDDGRLHELFTEIFDRYGHQVSAEVGDRLKQFGYDLATLSGLSTGLDDYNLPARKRDILAAAELRAAEISEQYDEGLITNEERYRLTVETWRQVDEQMLAELEAQFAKEDNSTTVTVESGARAKMGSVRQIAGMIGLLQDVYGNTIELPIRSSYKEGLSNIEYFTAARGARKGLIDTALKTADSGYLTRRMVDVAQDIFTLEDDCGEKQGLEVARQESEVMGEDFAARLIGRYVARIVKGEKGKILAKRGTLITKELAETIVGDASVETVHIRSVLKCQNLRGICISCYGVDLANGDLVQLRAPVGVMAAQAVGEPGTQLTLRTFHGGGVAGEDITQGLPRVEELFEARTPKGEAVLADISGQVSIAADGDNHIVTITSGNADVREYKTTGRLLRVKTGDHVKTNQILAAAKGGNKAVKTNITGIVNVSRGKINVIGGSQIKAYTIPQYRNLLVSDGDALVRGQRLTAGSINLQQLLQLTDESTVQRYIMTEIQSIFNMQGQTIADKHLEVIVRQMFSRVQIVDPGDSLFVTGDIVGRATAEEENRTLKTGKKQPATFKSLLLGITKVSTWSDSFLSAASFQDTTRVLINAAINGRVDELYGLKENVIIGRQIPVGTGYHGVPIDAAEETS